MNVQSTGKNVGPAADQIDSRWGVLGHIEDLVIDNWDGGYVVFLDRSWSDWRPRRHGRRWGYGWRLGEELQGGEAVTAIEKMAGGVDDDVFEGAEDVDGLCQVDNVGSGEQAGVAIAGVADVGWTEWDALGSAATAALSTDISGPQIGLEALVV